MTPEQQDLVETIRRVLAGDPEVEAAWLGGSLGRGVGDAFSDVDVVVLAAEGQASKVGERYAGDMAAIAEPALVMSLYGGRVLSVVTTDWRRFDFSLIEPGDLGRYNAAHLTPIFNKGDHSPPTRETAPYVATPGAVLPLVNEFLRVIGLSVGAIGREEWLLALSGIEILRRQTIDLMLEENGVGPMERGGALRRRPFLTSDQLSELEGLSPVVANREGVLAANAELAAIFLPRARRLAQRIGMAWPSVFEEATRRHLKTRLGFELS